MLVNNYLMIFQKLKPVNFYDINLKNNMQCIFCSYSFKSESKIFSKKPMYLKTVYELLKDILANFQVPV